MEDAYAGKSWPVNNLCWRERMRDEVGAIAVIADQRGEAAPRCDGMATLRRGFRGVRGYG